VLILSSYSVYFYLSLLRTLFAILLNFF
jgi:hypothetical protein